MTRAAQAQSQHEAAHHHLDRSSHLLGGFFLSVRVARRRVAAMKYWANLALALICYALVAITFAAAAGVIAGLLPFTN